MRPATPQDGVTDGILNEPNKCHFDRKFCCARTGFGQVPHGAQITALKEAVAGPIDARATRFFPGTCRAREAQGLGNVDHGFGAGQSLLFASQRDIFPNMVYEKAGLDINKDAKIEEA